MLIPNGLGPHTHVSREALSYPEGALGRERRTGATRNRHIGPILSRASMYTLDVMQWHPSRQKRPYIGNLRTYNRSGEIPEFPVFRNILHDLIQSPNVIVAGRVWKQYPS